jgi:hypothetical protein
MIQELINIFVTIDSITELNAIIWTMIFYYLCSSDILTFIAFIIIRFCLYFMLYFSFLSSDGPNGISLIPYLITTKSYNPIQNFHIFYKNLSW